MSTRWLTAWLLAAALALPAQAQPTYKCLRDGSVHYSDRPCDAGAAPALPLPDAAQPQSGPHTPPVQQFMSPECLNLADVIQRLRQQTVGAKHDAPVRARLGTEQKRWNESCSEDERQARMQVTLAERTERDKRRAAKEAQRAEQQRRADALAQCAEMARIRDVRRAQINTMNAGERADFERFELSFGQRCQNVPPR